MPRRGRRRRRRRVSLGRGGGGRGGRGGGGGAPGGGLALAVLRVRLVIAHELAHRALPVFRPPPPRARGEYRHLAFFRAARRRLGVRAGVLTFRSRPLPDGVAARSRSRFVRRRPPRGGAEEQEKPRVALLLRRRVGARGGGGFFIFSVRGAGAGAGGALSARRGSLRRTPGLRALEDALHELRELGVLAPLAQTEEALLRAAERRAGFSSFLHVRVHRARHGRLRGLARELVQVARADRAPGEGGRGGLGGGRWVRGRGGGRRGMEGGGGGGTGGGERDAIAVESARRAANSSRSTLDRRIRPSSDRFHGFFSVRSSEKPSRRSRTTISNHEE